MGHDVGVIVLCAMCDSYFLVTITSVEYKCFKGKKGTLALESYFEKLQNKLEQDRYAQMRCPTCMECITGKSYTEWIESGEPAHLSLVRFVTFDAAEPPPLYADEVNGGGKPKWSLAQGIGPRTLEMDKSRSNRLYKPALRGILGDWTGKVGGSGTNRHSSLEPFKIDPLLESPNVFLHKLATVNSMTKSSCSAAGTESRAFLDALFDFRPVYRCSEQDWHALQELAATALVRAQANDLSDLHLGHQKDEIKHERAPHDGDYSSLC